MGVPMVMPSTLLLLGMRKMSMYLFKSNLGGGANLYMWIICLVDVSSISRTLILIYGGSLN